MYVGEPERGARDGGERGDLTSRGTRGFERVREGSLGVGEGIRRRVFILVRTRARGAGEGIPGRPRASHGHARGRHRLRLIPGCIGREEPAVGARPCTRASVHRSRRGADRVEKAHGWNHWSSDVVFHLRRVSLGRRRGPGGADERPPGVHRAREPVDGGQRVREFPPRVILRLVLRVNRELRLSHQPDARDVGVASGFVFLPRGFVSQARGIAQEASLQRSSSRGCVHGGVLHARQRRRGFGR